MTTFLALYRGKTVADAKMVAVTADPCLVADVVNRLLAQPQEHDDDPVVRAIVDLHVLRFVANHNRSD